MQEKLKRQDQLLGFRKTVELIDNRIFKIVSFLILTLESYSEPSTTAMMEIFAKIVNGSLCINTFTTATKTALQQTNPA